MLVRRNRVLHESAWRRVLHAVTFALLQGLNLQTVAGTDTAFVKDSIPEPLSLAAAQSRAFERNWDLLAARADVDVATAQRIVAKEFPNPTLNFSVNKVSVDSAYPNQGSGFWGRNYDTIAAFNQLLEIGGKRHDRQLSARAGYEGAEARFADARRLLDLAVARAYIGALQADATSRTLQDSAASLRHESTIAEVRVKAGDISESDRNQIEIAARRLELDAQTAAVTARTARINLELLLGDPKGQGTIALSDALEHLAEASPPGDIGPATLEERPDLLAARANLQKAEADLKLQKALRIPDPTLILQYEHEPPDLPNTIGLGISLPLPLWNQNRGNINAAAAQVDQARLAAAKLRAQISADLATAKLAYEDARRRSHEYLALRETSEQVRRSVAFAYEKGGASLVDLLTAERNDNEVRLASAQAAGDLASAAAGLRAAAQTMNSFERKR